MIPTKVAIGSHRYVVDLSKVIRRPLATMRQLTDQGAERGEQSLDNPALWRRTCSDFVLGQGQEFFDQEQEADPRRCRSVINFDPLSKRRALTTSISFGTAVSAFTASGNFHRIIRTIDRWWWASGSQITRSGSHTVFTTTSVTGGPTQTNFRDMCVFGSTVYVAYGSSGVYSGSATGSTIASFSASAATCINADLGRLVCGNGTTLFELSSAGVSIPIFTHPNPQWSWTSFAAGNAGIYCAGNDGIKSEIYISTVIDATGALGPPIPVAQLPAGELVRRIAYFGGFLVICTSVGVRVAQASQTGLLTYGPVIELGDTLGVVFEGRFAYVSVSSLATTTGFGAKAGVAQLSLERFTAPLTPAYAIISCIDSATAYTARDVGVVNGLVLGLFSNSGNNEIRIMNTTTPNPTYGTGKYFSGAITFGTPEPKIVHSVEVEFDALVSGTSITVTIYDLYSGSTYGTATTSTVGATSLVCTPSSELRSPRFEIYITAVGASGGKSVTVRRWTARAVVAPTYVTEEIILPVMLGQEVLADDGTNQTYDPRTEWTYLTGLMRTKASTSVTFGGETVNCWVDQVGAENSWHRWDMDDAWPDGTVFVRLLTTGL